MFSLSLSLSLTVWQLWDQSPQLFEFDSSLLIFLIDAIYSARFGTFLADTEKERKTGTARDSEEAAALF